MYKQHDRTEKEQTEVHSAISFIKQKYLNGQLPDKEMKDNHYYKQYDMLEDPTVILEQTHSIYAMKKLQTVGQSIMGLDVGQPWCIYWPANTLDILQEISYSHLYEKIIKFISYCQWSSGGYGGGHIQIPHLAPTYSSILSLLLVGTVEAYESIDREKLQQFFYSVRNPEYKVSHFSKLIREATYYMRMEKVICEQSTSSSS